ncbi:hypothetical protein BJX76DRAFT_354007 [Aspergillus varians]
MASGPSFTKALHATAVLAGSFLSGSMITISIISMPALLDATTQPSQIFHQWIRMFHYGHRTHTTISALTLTLYACTAWRRSAVNKPWGTMILASVITVLMTPFTWVAMIPTNKTIAGFASGSRDAAGVTIQQARRLITQWSWLHLARSFFPLAGAVVGMNQLLGD